MQAIEPTITFLRLIPAAPEPRRADRAAGGHVPLRGFRFCDPVTSASPFGWWVFPPMGFSLMSDGGPGVLWTYENDDTWYPLRTTQFSRLCRIFCLHSALLVISAVVAFFVFSEMPNIGSIAGATILVLVTTRVAVSVGRK